jgi:hypothetical protein
LGTRGDRAVIRLIEIASGGWCQKPFQRFIENADFINKEWAESHPLAKGGEAWLDNNVFKVRQ